MTKEEKDRKLRLEFMREQVQEVELQARYWKATHDTKFYSLADSKLKPEYEAYFAEIQAAAEKAAEDLEASPDPNLTVESSILEGMVEASATTSVSKSKK